MKVSIYYAMGSYQLADEEFQRVLQLDPSNQEVRAFVEFLKNRKGAPQPPLPAAPGAGTGGAAVRPGAAPPAAAPAQPPARTR
jgi:tetratricopeptide (TPR) repeat protein